MQKIVLVTGCAGFIGSHIAENLLKRGDKVIGIDELNDYYSISLKEQNLTVLTQFENFKFYKVDIRNREAIDEIFLAEKPAHVAHLAARAGVRPSIVNPWIYLSANIEGTVNLLEISKDVGVENFVLTSSSSVNGNSKIVPFKEDDSMTDKPISQYAATKKACELFGHTYHHLYGLNVNVIRPFNVYGPRGRPDMAPWLFIEKTLKEEEITQYGDGSMRRDFTYINDFAEGFIKALDTKLGYEIFNLGNSTTVSVSEALKITSKIVGKSQKIKVLPQQPGDVDITNADISKAKRLLGYNPKTDFETGMREFYNWYLQR